MFARFGRVKIGTEGVEFEKSRNVRGEGHSYSGVHTRKDGVLNPVGPGNLPTAVRSGMEH
jgi:hypothetical protein